MTRAKPNREQRDRALIDASATIAPTAIIGKLYRPCLSGSPVVYRNLEIGPNVWVGDYAIIGAGCVLNDGIVVDDYVKLEPNVMIGANSLILYRAYVSLECEIGANCVVGAFLTDRTKIADGCRVFGTIVHKHRDIGKGWDDDSAREASSYIGANSFVGFDARIIGPVRVGAGSYIAAGATVTRNVPPHTRVVGLNQFSRMGSGANAYDE
ncbi:MAG TPA: DapH/DapD/GlmU-related protein [Allosphingosinicella sp.]|jgi:bifunctional UDP-N-acetylglucosamine pyrophosphorylase/glucosamine-1-phosphate N-acetyltransferase